MGNRNLLIYLFSVAFSFLCFYGVFKFSEWIEFIIYDSNSSNKNDILYFTLLLVSVIFYFISDYLLKRLEYSLNNYIIFITVILKLLKGFFILLFVFNTIYNLLILSKLNDITLIVYILSIIIVLYFIYKKK